MVLKRFFGGLARWWATFCVEPICEENVSLPKGPDEVGEVWRAQSRLTVSCHGSLVWGPSLAKEEIHVFYSRIIEKSSSFTTLVLQALLDKLKASGALEGITDLLLWSDCGNHYRSVKLVSMAAFPWVDRYRSSIHLRWHLEKHGKSEMDGVFGVLSRNIEEAAASRWVSDVDHLCDLQRKASDARRIANSPTMKFYDFMPSESKDEWERDMRIIERTSLPTNLNASHDWCFKIADRRRLDNSLLAHDRRSITGVFTRASGLPHTRSMGSVHLKLALPSERLLVLAAEAHDAEELRSSDIGHDVQFILGWRATYRKNQPELPRVDNVLARLGRKENNFAVPLSRLPIGARHLPARSIEACKEASRKEASKWRERMRA
jgi:hypothetical protein